MLEVTQQGVLQNVYAPFGREWAKFLCDEVIKHWDSPECDAFPNQCLHGNPAEEERDTRTQSNADQHRRRCEASLVRPEQRTAQDPFGRLALLHLHGNLRATLRP